MVKLVERTTERANDIAANGAIPADHAAETDSLRVLVIDTPCPMDWDRMEGDERKRYCSRCQKHVFNFAAMTRSETEHVINNGGDTVCARIFRRPDGKIVTSECSIPGKKVTGRRFQFSIATLVALLTSSAAVFASVPWIGKQIEPIVLQWFGPDVPAPAINSSFATLGSIAIRPRQAELELVAATILIDLPRDEQDSDETVSVDIDFPLLPIESPLAPLQ